MWTSCDPSDEESYKSGCKRGGVQDSVGESDQVGVRKKERTCKRSWGRGYIKEKGKERRRNE